MTRRAKQLLKPMSVGQNATLKVPDVDRGPCDPRNLLVVIMHVENDMYQVGCREGTLKTKYSAADLDSAKQNLLKVEDVPAIELALRTAVSKTTGGQGYLKCSCKSNCKTLRCSCKKRGSMCNSRCHPGLSCTNHD